MKFQFLTENFSRSENAPPFETRKIRHFEVERIFLENKKMVDDFHDDCRIPFSEGIRRCFLLNRDGANDGNVMDGMTLIPSISTLDRVVNS